MMVLQRSHAIENHLTILEVAENASGKDFNLISVNKGRYLEIYLI